MINSKGLPICKHLFLILLIFSIFLTGPLLSTASAATETDSPRVILNDQLLSFEVPPVIENGRTMVPVRTIFEAMGASVNWNASSRVVTASKGAITVIMPINATTPKVNGSVIKLDVPSKIVNNRTLAPLRFVGEAFGGRVSWDSITRTIYINNASVEKPPAVKVNTYLVNLRNGPSTLAAVMDHAHSGEVLAVMAEQDGWFQISRGGQTAWLASWSGVVSSEVGTNPQPQPPIVVLDAGHGGYDPGAIGKTLKEKEVNLEITLKVGELLTQKGIAVTYTRSDDQFVGLEERSNIANSLNASLFVSIHNNANQLSSISGTETYFYAPADTPDLYAQRNERARLANAIQTELVANLQRLDHGVKEANLSVLRNTQMPSVLVEVAFISNPTEEALLQNNDFINRAALGIVNGIIAFMN
jgi:N-acetylmuramoyl-L-alanine amidase